MKCNVGTTDRLLRIVLGLVIAIFGIIFNSWWGLIALVPLATGLYKWCPLYSMMGFSTVKKEE